MRNRKRNYNSKPFLVIGGPHDGQAVNVLAAPIAPIENVIRLPIPQELSAANVMPANIVEPRQQDEVIEYYVQQVRRFIPNTDKPWLEPVVESYWLYHVDKVMTGWEEDIHVIFSRLREFYKVLA